ncbi:MAG: histidine phosphatase family protein [Deltaproteobacteria bacterium]|jgi:alpha-ribazole phosphatase/probable phosphoglycerate mutase|nr:histidine phosphatase family protein [Deltaproteobacteria bacterium]
MSFLRLFFIRHGQTENFGSYPFNGWTDVQLTDEGRRQLDQTVQALRGVPLTAVYSSDLSRAAYGGLALARELGLSLKAEKDFREIFFGKLEGLTWSVIQEKYPDLAERISHPGADVTFPGGESASQFRARVEGALARLLKDHPVGQVALVAHAGVNRAILAGLLGLSLAAMWSITQDFACLNVVDIYPEGGAQVRLVNAYAGPEGYYQGGPGFERIARL